MGFVGLSSVMATDPSSLVALALSGLGALAKAAPGAAASVVVGAIADRAFLSVIRRARDFFRDEPSSPDAETISRSVRIAQLDTLSQLLGDYERSIRVPRLFWSRARRLLVERLPGYIARERERAIDPRLSGRLRARFEADDAALVAINSALQEGTDGWSVADAAIPVGANTQGSGVTDQARRVEQTLDQLAGQAILDELRYAIGGVDLPRDFVSMFLGERAGQEGFIRSFREQLQHTLTTSEEFYRAYTVAALADLQTEVRETRASSARAERSVEALRVDQRLGVANSGDVLPSGDSRHFMTTDSYFGRWLNEGSVFHHGRALVGRQDILARLLECVESRLASARATVVSLAAVGGSGKSRLLLEVARRIDAAAVRWVRDGEPVSFGALSELPAGPLVLICDDAHRRPDLTELIRLVDFRSDPTVLILGVRPYGRAAVSTSVNVARFHTENWVDLGHLGDVPISELEGIVAEELGTTYAHAAYDLLRLAGGSILVALVAARLLRTKNRDPRTVPLDADFRQTVLEGFREESFALLPDVLDQRAAQRSLEALAAVQPVVLRGGDLTEAFAAYVGVDGSTLQRIIDALVRAGVLRDERSGLRIQPDVLGDHILHRAMIARGAPTQLDRELLERLGPAVLLNLVQNVAELDWQHEAFGDPVRMFEGVWTSFIQAFREAPLEDQRDWLKKLAPVALFQPRAMLDFANGLLTSPPDVIEVRGRWGTLNTYAQVLQELPPLIALSANHRPTVAQALDLLWQLGGSDSRTTNPYPDHGIRQLQDVVGYSRQRELWMQHAALDAMERWLTKAEWVARSHTPLLVAEAVLATEMIEQIPARDGSSLTLSRFGVHAANTMELRLRAIAILGRLLLSGDVRERHAALPVLLNAVGCQRGTFGHELTEQEEAEFEDQFAAILDVLEDVVEQGTDPVAMLLIRTRLHMAAYQTHLDWKALRMREIAASVLDNEDTRLARALAHFNTHWESFERSIEEDMAADEDNRARVAVELAAGYPASSSLAVRLGTVCEAWVAAREFCDASPLLHRLATQDGALATALAQHLLEVATASPTVQIEWLISLLRTIRNQDSDSYDDLLIAASTHIDKRVRAAAAGSMEQVLGDNRRSSNELVVLRSLLRDRELVVARASIRALTFMEVDEINSLLGDVQLHADRVAAGNLSDIWHMRRRGKPIPRPDEATVQRLLAQIVSVPNFRRSEPSIGEMLSTLAELYPHDVLNFLDARVREEHRLRAERQRQGQILDLSDDSYDAIPYGGFEGLQDAFERSPDYVGVIRRVLGALGSVVDGVVTHDAAAHDVLSSFRRWDSVLEDVLRGWMMGKDRDMLVRSASLFTQLGSTFVLEHHSLVADLLEFLEECEPATRTTVTKALMDGALSGPPIPRAVGTPSPMMTGIEAGAESLAKVYAGVNRPQACRFYEDLSELARECLRRERERDIQAADRMPSADLG